MWGQAFHSLLYFLHLFPSKALALQLRGCKEIKLQYQYKNAFYLIVSEISFLIPYTNTYVPEKLMTCSNHDILVAGPHST